MLPDGRSNLCPLVLDTLGFGGTSIRYPHGGVQCRYNFGVDHKVGQVVEAGRLPIDDHQGGPALLRERREPRRRIDNRRRPDGQEKVAGENLLLGPPLLGLGRGLKETQIGGKTTSRVLASTGDFNATNLFFNNHCLPLISIPGRFFDKALERALCWEECYGGGSTHRPTGTGWGAVC